ncbi:CGL34 [Auxenochlorella protothecoides x Auxenochlorella symbiontica]
MAGLSCALPARPRVCPSFTASAASSSRISGHSTPNLGRTPCLLLPGRMTRARPAFVTGCPAPRLRFTTTASLSPPAGHERQGSPSTSGASPLPTCLAAPTTGMARGLGSSSGGATLERSKLSLKQRVTQTAPKLDDGMGGGGLGKGVFNGGGGGDDGGDDDDYSGGFGEGDDGGGDDGFFRKVLSELYDARALAAVLQEWYRGVGDLPFVLRQAVQMGLVSSASLVRFMAMDVRPGVTRALTRALPPTVSREVVGRLMADPAFMQKLALEQAITIASSLAYEARTRGDAFLSELDLVAANTLSLAAANAALVYLVAPTRAAPAPARHAWRNALARLPNNVFDAATPMRAYTPGARAAALGVKCAQLCGVGLVAGGAQAALGRALCALRRARDPTYAPSVPVPALGKSALGAAAAMGVFANARYQVIAGVDRYLFDHAAYLWSYLAASGAFRALSTHLGDQTRLYLQGMPLERPAPAPGSTSEREAAARELAKALKQQVAARQAAPAPPRRRKRPAGFEMGIGAPA